MSKWYSFKELKRARTPMLLDSETGLPDNHVITVVERVISVDDPELIQNNVRTDTFTLNLDAEYDDLNVVVIFTKPNNINVKVAYNGTPTHIPGSAMELVGSLACSVVGIDADGEVRAVTKAAPDTFQVVKSGAYDGSVTSDDAELLGQILQAVSDTEAAINAAETATTAATNATSQATSAATSANQAASSANSAASSANSAATRATSAAVNAENAYDTLQPYMATIDSCANILHSKVGPDTVVTADDSFPCKPVEMVVYGNTTQNLWVNPSGTNNGITCAANVDGSVTVSGTASAQYATVSINTYILKPSTTYYLSIDKNATPSDAYFYVRENAASGNVAHYLGGNGTGTTNSFTTKSDTSSAVFAFCVNTIGHTPSGTYRVMLNEGSTAEPWCPPGLNSVGDGGSVDIVTAGKNLLTKSEFNSIGWAYDSRGTVDTLNALPVGTYKISGIFELISSTLDSSVYGYVVTTSQDKPLASNGHAWNSTVAGTVKTCADTLEITDAMRGDFTHFYIYGCGQNGVGTTGLANIKLQLELGSTATDYEPPNITTTPIDLQGHTLNALPDGTRDELHIDGGGNVVLEKRTHKSVVDGDLNWSAKNSVGQFISANAVEYAAPITSKEYINTFIDKLIPSSDLQNSLCISNLSGRDLYLREPAFASDGIEVKSWFANNPTTIIYKLAEPQTIDLGTITPPTMAAPNVTAYVADDTPAEMELDYVRDINIVVDRLEKKVADLVVTEATIV